MTDLAISAPFVFALLVTLIYLIFRLHPLPCFKPLLSWVLGALLMATLVIAGIIAELDSAPWPTGFTITQSSK